MKLLPFLLICCSFGVHAQQAISREQSGEQIAIRTDTLFADESDAFIRPLFYRMRQNDQWRQYQPFLFSNYPGLLKSDSLFLVSDSSAFTGVIVLNRLDPYRGIQSVTIVDYANGLMRKSSEITCQFTVLATIADTLHNNPVNTRKTYGEPHWKTSEQYDDYSGDTIGLSKHFYSNGRLSRIDSSYTTGTDRCHTSVCFLKDGRIASKEFFINGAREGEQFYLWNDRYGQFFEIRGKWKNGKLTDMLNNNLIYLDRTNQLVSEAAFFETADNDYTLPFYIPVKASDHPFDFIVSFHERPLMSLSKKQIRQLIKKAEKQRKKDIAAQQKIKITRKKHSFSISM